MIVRLYYCDGLCETPVVFRWLFENRDGFYIFFAVGCASGSYVEWFFVRRGRGRLLFFAFRIIISIFFVCSCYPKSVFPR